MEAYAALALGAFLAATLLQPTGIALGVAGGLGGGALGALAAHKVADARSERTAPE